ncbi:TonB-dependent receptor [Brevundimonas nasdae]|uniref:TonB-dependent receptor n=1 Tax=Brevundimonas nasdae TaxID=172043 RepID=A0ABX8THP0_9CAUL|nr:TonB-dependent receptor [Brevundimonas nasdae]QYC09315.1 TonB-dependent receptor [Brevundimonas nasdae]QYC15363.1 TonB-dependent receptor [Brevundimonas nasdae]
MAWLPLIAAFVTGHSAAILEPVEASRSQVAAQKLEAPVQVDDVEVFGRRGAALTPPQLELDGADIDALHAWSIDEVLKRMGEILALGEQPMVLINGQPTPNLSAYTGFPPDALVRAEVLPTQAGGIYGAASGQRVVNLVLQSQFSSYDGRLVGTRPTQGGTSSLSGDLRRSAIAGRNTQQIGLRLARDTALRAGERKGYLARDESDDEIVTIRPESASALVNLSATRALGDWSGVFSMNAQTQDSRGIVRFGNDVVATDRSFENLTASAGFSGQAIGWFLQANLNGRAAWSRERGLQDLRNDSQAFTLTGSARRSLLDLPAGALTGNLNTSLMTNRSVGTRDGVSIDNAFQSQDLQALLAVPLSKAGAASFPRRLLGDLAATFGAGVRQSGGGGGEELRAGLSWAPHRGIRLNGEWVGSTESVPDIVRTEPEYYGAPIVVFDFRNGEAVEILPLRGGNPDLSPPRSDRFSLITALGPFTSWAISANVAYQRAKASDGIGALPGLTEEIEVAFPERFQRDPEGRLISIDYRPVNFSSTLTESLSTGLNFNLPRPTGVGEGKATVLRIAVNHTLQLSSIIQLRGGLRELDRLHGDGGGLARQNARVMVDARRGPWGANVSAQWQDGYRTRRVGGQDGPGDLVVSPFTTVDLRLSLQLTSSGLRMPAEDGPQRRSGGVQVNLDIENLLDARREARLGDGSVAPGYGRDVQDPLGQTVRLTLQQRF